jgi:hypothetical protein
MIILWASKGFIMPRPQKLWPRHVFYLVCF